LGWQATSAVRTEVARGEMLFRQELAVIDTVGEAVLYARIGATAHLAVVAGNRALISGARLAYCLTNFGWNFSNIPSMS